METTNTTEKLRFLLQNLPRYVEVFEACDLCGYMNEFGSDKGNGWHNYTKVYDALFRQLRHKAVNVFEVGLGTPNVLLPSNMGVNGKYGASLFGWSRYFDHPETFIGGADIDVTTPLVIPNDLKERNIKHYYVDQLNRSVLNQLCQNDLKHLAKSFDVVIDDGLHTFEANLNTLSVLFEELLRPGGIYVIEDILGTNSDVFEKEIVQVYAARPDVALAYYLRLPNSQNGHDNNLIVIVKSVSDPMTGSVHPVPGDSEYAQQLRKHFYHFTALGNIMLPYFSQWKNCGSYLIDGQSTCYEPKMLDKQIALYNVSKKATNALEVGVHGGHSLLIMLLANPMISITAIDIGIWPHTRLCVDYLNKHFGHRIHYIEGDSAKVLEQLCIRLAPYDLIHLDGAHCYDYVALETNHARRLGTKNAIIVYENYDSGIKKYVDEQIDLKVLEIPGCAWTNIITQRIE